MGHALESNNIGLFLVNSCSQLPSRYIFGICLFPGKKVDQSRGVQPWDSGVLPWLSGDKTIRDTYWLLTSLSYSYTKAAVQHGALSQTL